MIYAGFESILVTEDNGKQNPEESYTNKYQKHVGCSYSYKLVRFDGNFNKTFKSYLGEDAFYNAINSMIKEIKYCNEVTRKHFNKKLVMTKEDDEDFKSSIKCWICENVYVEGDVKVIDNCRITGKYRGSAHRDCNINVELNHKIPILFYNLKNGDSHPIMQELCKFNFKINAIPDGLEKYI